MRFSFTDDQRLFAEGLADMLSSECTPAHVRSVWEDGTGHSPDLWRRLGDMGVLSLLVPESDGGMGASYVDAVLLFVELGRAGVPGPILEHMVAAAPALAASRPSGLSQELIDGLLDGTSVGTASLDDSPYVAHAATSDVILYCTTALTGHESVDAHGIDGGRRIATVSGGREVDVTFDVDTTLQGLTLATAGYLVGTAERMIDIAAEYARQREQFGKPIGSFQAVKHLLSDALLAVEFAKAPLFRAAFSLTTGADTTLRDVSMAKALANDAAYRSSRSTMQVHGGIGYTWEADLQLFMKKSWALMRAYGDSTFHRRRVSAAVL
jgi:alkylation response protein AidB-like acyl-CoA dehydrogenase